MNVHTPRLRIFAGPNGSGKSSLKLYLPPNLLGVYLNPDEIEKTIREQGFIDLRVFGITAPADEVLNFFNTSKLLISSGFMPAAEQLAFANGLLSFGNAEINSYFASVAVDFIRQKLLALRTSFTIETVMSHPSKVELLKKAQEAGYRTYLYYVATSSPNINVSRVKRRAELGGHDVPERLIISRYQRSLDLLMSAIRYSNRAYVFDNSEERTSGEHIWLAEITDGKTLDFKSKLIPDWFDSAVTNKIRQGKSSA